MAKKKRTRVKRHTTTRSSRSGNRRWFLFFLLPVLVIGVVGVFYNPKTASVLGASTVAFRQGDTSWNAIPGAAAYNIYYKAAADRAFIHSVPRLPASITSYTIGYLKKGVQYQYIVTALDSSGKEFWSSGVKWMTNYR
ncbi:MAG TPA: fibronectin type III domain-containing protein [Candidatus Saccharimonadales bacterium]|nr:fibronectin type III domain-containing protein [Candidatus Saccharimonadales bacterium]